VGFVVDKVALGHIFLRVFLFYPSHYQSTNALLSHLSPLAGTIGLFEVAVPRVPVSRNPANSLFALKPVLLI
jgi:hypothetical protein